MHNHEGEAPEPRPGTGPASADAAHAARMACTEAMQRAVISAQSSQPHSRPSVAALSEFGSKRPHVAPRNVSAGTSAGTFGKGRQQCWTTTRSGSAWTSPKATTAYCNGLLPVNNLNDGRPRCRVNGWRAIRGLMYMYDVVCVDFLLTRRAGGSASTRNLNVL